MTRQSFIMLIVIMKVRVRDCSFPHSDPLGSNDTKRELFAHSRRKFPHRDSNVVLIPLTRVHTYREILEEYYVRSLLCISYIEEASIFKQPD